MSQCHSDDDGGGVGGEPDGGARHDEPDQSDRHHLAATVGVAEPAAREAACAAVQSGEYGRRELTIRINGADTEWHEADMAAYARRIVRFVDGVVASDQLNPQPAGLHVAAVAAETETH